MLLEDDLWILFQRGFIFRKSGFYAAHTENTFKQFLGMMDSVEKSNSGQVLRRLCCVHCNALEFPKRVKYTTAVLQFNLKEAERQCCLWTNNQMD